MPIFAIRLPPEIRNALRLLPMATIREALEALTKK